MDFLSKVWKWTKIIAGAILAIAITIITLGVFKKPKPPVIEDERIREIDNRIDVNLEEAERLDRERKDKEREIEEAAEEAKRKLEEIEKREDRPGDAARSADDFERTW